jgi:hypothetical protein
MGIFKIILMMTVEIADLGVLDGNYLSVSNNALIRPSNVTWLQLTQTINITKSHFVSFDQIIEGDNSSIEISLLIDNADIEMNLTLDEHSTTNQIIYYGNKTGVVDVTIQVLFTNADLGTKIHLDNFSIVQYEHRVYIVILNDYWETMGDEIVRKNLFESIHDVSFFFEAELGIKLIPVLELEWHPNSTRMAVVDDIALDDAGRLLKLQDDWDVEYGRSPDNHGFDLLLTFSNRTSEHYGFAYYRANAAFHFAQSEELGEYSWLTIVEDWAENLIQHEISHNFGAYDRDRSIYPPSVMSKPSTPEQALADFTTNLLWLQVNNWLIEDILLMLEYKSMFD